MECRVPEQFTGMGLAVYATARSCGMELCRGAGLRWELWAGTHRAVVASPGFSGAV